MAKTLISTHTASASATLDITSGIDGTYPVYEFHMVNLHCSQDSRYPCFRTSIDGGSNYNLATTTTYVRSHHEETGASYGVGYQTGYDAAGTDATSGGNIFISEDTGADNDQAMSGILTLYDPSSTTFVKHFILETTTSNGGNWNATQYIGGNVNTTSAVNAIRFLFHLGNIDTGVIKMFGVS